MKDGLIVRVISLVAACAILCSCGKKNEFEEESAPKKNTVETNNELVIEDISDSLKGTITLLTPYISNDEISYFMKLFSELHPDVQFVRNEYGSIRDTAQLSALITELLADPPDIFTFMPAYMPLEKISYEGVFADLYTYYNGPRGIDQSRYFANIFRACERDGSLYYTPLSIRHEFAVLNKRFLEAIDYDPSQLTGFTLDDEIDLYHKVAEALPDKLFYPSRSFCIAAPFIRERIYDVSTGEVFINTPEMRIRLEKALQIPVDKDWVTFTPDGLVWMEEYRKARRLADYYLSPEEYAAKGDQGGVYLSVISSEGGMQNFVTMLLQEHPAMQYTNPIPIKTGTDYSRFFMDEGFAIMENSHNKALAWEFLRFMMEYEESLYYDKEQYMEAMRNKEIYYFYSEDAFANAPVNRVRFENQVKQLVLELYDIALERSDVENYITLPLEEHKDVMTRTVMDTIRDMTESLNYEVRSSYIILYSLIYPELWLLHSGQQDVPTTLKNLQQRLELYVVE